MVKQLNILSDKYELSDSTVATTRHSLDNYTLSVDYTNKYNETFPLLSNDTYIELKMNMVTAKFIRLHSATAITLKISIGGSDVVFNGVTNLMLEATILDSIYVKQNTGASIDVTFEVFG